MVTIKDVAKAAKVSVTVVSKSMNGYPDVNELTRRKVLRIAEELNYTPNMIAKNLKQKVTKSIALIFSNFEHANGKDGVLFQIMSGIFAAAEEYKYEVAIYTRSLSEQQNKSYWKFCKDHRISCAVVTGLKTSDPYFQEIVNSDFPCVVLDADLASEHTGSVSTDNVNAAKSAVEFLISNNHRRIGMINGHEFAVVSRQRLEGYKAALEQHGIEYDPSIVMNSDYLEESVYALAESYLQGCPDVTAIFFASDLMAIGFMNRCREIGVRIPEDISIIGFDDIVISSYTTPKLSTVRQNFHKLAYQASKHVINILEKDEKGKSIMMPFKIVDRETIKKL
ncbi:LacI family DNA-binding transcriptional regulator [Paenibacillus sp. FA6]|uniref:LacI family DNA-binding transcriptional regulator n=1 Tax=Paenibacillus sp. FA6 TaxID=3413029 RepID=UPI003F65DD53